MFSIYDMYILTACAAGLVVFCLAIMFDGD
jgi:hypothetical protein